MAHPPLAAGWIDAPHHVALLGRMPLESGNAIEDLHISYVVHGSLDDRSKPIVFGLCAIGSTHHRLDFLIGAGRALDPSRHTVVMIDALGNGLSSSPSNSPKQLGERFPRFSIRDMVTSQRMLASHLGIDAVHAVIGASMGGMQALQWGVSYPDFAKLLVAMVPMAKTTPWSQAVNHAGRLALSDARPLPTPEARWEAWVTVMYVFAQRTPSRFSQDVAGAANSDATSDTLAWIAERTRLMAAQGADPLDWIYQSYAYDAHDLGTSPGFDGDTQQALASIRAPTLVAVPPLDLYNPVEAGVWAAQQIPRGKLLRLPSNSGHLVASDAEPQSAAMLNDAIGRFLRDEEPAL
ncbi:alpha/beta fold hydrolase [Bradyrhizobium sp. CSA207]|uniref:alpha/beta fold hydrolase n=1 Tax=Bradyrhizobium sp. CSA207 TaxID=2698826 RepID=UPI0023B18890|nr:alpha/beta fold hydrolase [Bradyrhizobium sp. CSA207]MDE5446768.1 alpha/beta fold hydrolase [Bradyrhizobium sp. CSA207]